jgi:transposase
MDDRSLYAAILGLTGPWGVERVELELEAGEVHVWVSLPPETLWICPECLERAPIHDHRDRTWRHLDTCQYRTLVHARVPRLDCPNHGIKQLRVPWAEERARFTAMFEALAIDWMKRAPLATVAERLRLSWDEAAAIQERAVARGLRRRVPETVAHLGIDETSFQRQHEYVTVVTNLDRDCVLYVADDRRTESLDEFWKGLSPEQLMGVKAVAMDMWDPYIGSTQSHLPGAAEKIVFDKYHIAALANRALDLVRRRENRRLREEGKDTLVGTKYLWLRNPNNFRPDRWREFATLRESKLQTARGWALKEMLMATYEYSDPAPAEEHFGHWYRWARRSRLEPFRTLAATIRERWDNIKTWFRFRLTNAGSEAMNAKIQAVKYMSRGFRNRHRFRMAILFHLGGLDLYPTPLSKTR